MAAPPMKSSEAKIMKLPEKFDDSFAKEDEAREKILLEPTNMSSDVTRRLELQRLDQEKQKERENLTDHATWWRHPERVALKRVLEKPFDDRSQEDLSVIMDYITDIKKLQHWTLADKLKLARIMTVKDYEPKEHVVQEGSQGQELYIILRGLVTVSRYDKETQGRISLGHMLEGDCFGEVGFLGEQMERTASIITEETCSFLIADRKDLEDEFKMTNKELVRQLESFLRHVPIFSSFDEHTLVDLALCMEVKKYRFNEVVCKEGEQPDGMYFVKHGECTVLRKVAFLTKTTSTKLSLDRSLAMSEMKETQEVWYDKVAHVNTLRQYQFFGEVSILKKSARTATVVTNSPGTELYFVRIGDLLRRLKKHQMQCLLDFADYRYATDEQIRKAVVRSTKWDEYKKKLIKDLKEKPPYN